MDNNTNQKEKILLIATEPSLIEGEALRQLEKTSQLKGIEYAIGLPDLHPGRGNPIGAAFLSSGMIYPYLIGNDVGCGVGLFQTDLKVTKIKSDKWIKKLADLDQPYDGDLGVWQKQYQIDPSLADAALGTIGGGNHFAELQRVEKILAPELFEQLKLSKNHLMVLIHSGSRSLGDSLLRSHTDRFGANGLETESTEAQVYLKNHDEAVKWAIGNRALIAYRFCESIGTLCQPIVDIPHNGITRIESDTATCFIHRKGAAVSDTGPIVIPGSRGNLSYLVNPIGDQAQNLFSLPHGAGRKWNRGSCKDRLKDRFPAKSLVKTELGSLVICDDKELLYEEAPMAYKNIDKIIDGLTQAGLVEVIATLKPVITYKMRKIDR